MRSILQNVQPRDFHWIFSFDLEFRLIFPGQFRTRLKSKNTLYNPTGLSNFSFHVIENFRDFAGLRFVYSNNLRYQTIRTLDMTLRSLSHHWGRFRTWCSSTMPVSGQNSRWALTRVSARSPAYSLLPSTTEICPSRLKTSGTHISCSFWCTRIDTVRMASSSSALRSILTAPRTCLSGGPGGEGSACSSVSRLISWSITSGISALLFRAILLYILG